MLQIRTLRVSPPYDGLLFVYRIGPTQYDTDFYNNFIAPPSSLLTGALVQWLSRSSAFTVCEPSSDIPSDLALRGNITALYIDSTDASSPKAVVAGRFFLTRDQAGGVELLSDKTYDASAPVSDRTPAGFSAAWGRAYRQLLTDLTHDVNQTLQSRGASARR